MAILSVEQIEQIRARLNTYCFEHSEISNTDIAQGSGYTSGTISLFRNNKYSGNNADVAEKIEGYLNNLSLVESNQTESELKFAPTQNSKAIFKLADYSLFQSTIGVVTGIPGIGKTKAVKEYKKRNPTTILVEVPPLITPVSLLRLICSELNVPTISYKNEKSFNISKDILFNQIIQKLKGTRRLLIFDEGENLTVQCLEIVRRIQDFTGIGVLLSGTSRLLDRLRGPRKELQQLFSRVGIQKEIRNLGLDDVQKILQMNYPEASKYAGTFLSLSKQNARILQHLIALVKNTTRITQESLSVDLIDDAASSLLI